MGSSEFLAQPVEICGFRMPHHVVRADHLFPFKLDVCKRTARNTHRRRKIDLCLDLGVATHDPLWGRRVLVVNGILGKIRNATLLRIYDTSSKLSRFRIVTRMFIGGSPQIGLSFQSLPHDAHTQAFGRTNFALRPIAPAFLPI